MPHIHFDSLMLPVQHRCHLFVRKVSNKIQQILHSEKYYQENNKIGAIKKMELNSGTKLVRYKSLLSGNAPENPGRMVTLSFNGE